MTGVKYPGIHINLSNEDGNAFFILSRCRAAMRKNGIPKCDIDAFTKSASGGDYDRLLQVVKAHFETS